MWTYTFGNDMSVNKVSTIIHKIKNNKISTKIIMDVFIHVINGMSNLNSELSNNGITNVIVAVLENGYKYMDFNYTRVVTIIFENYSKIKSNKCRINNLIFELIKNKNSNMHERKFINLNDIMRDALRSQVRPAFIYEIYNNLHNRDPRQWIAHSLYKTTYTKPFEFFYSKINGMTTEILDDICDRLNIISTKDNNYDNVISSILTNDLVNSINSSHIDILCKCACTKTIKILFMDKRLPTNNLTSLSLSYIAMINADLFKLLIEELNITLGNDFVLGFFSGKSFDFVRRSLMSYDDSEMYKFEVISKEEYSALVSYLLKKGYCSKVSESIVTFFRANFDYCSINKLYENNYLDDEIIINEFCFERIVTRNNLLNKQKLNVFTNIEICFNC